MSPVKNKLVYHQGIVDSTSWTTKNASKDKNEIELICFVRIVIAMPILRKNVITLRDLERKN